LPGQLLKASDRKIRGLFVFKCHCRIYPLITWLPGRYLRMKPAKLAEYCWWNVTYGHAKR
jgi:hypothetical protein